MNFIHILYRTYCMICLGEHKKRFESGAIKMWPPPPAVIVISVVQVICFILQAGDVGFWSYSIYVDGSSVIERCLVFDSRLQLQAWRFLSYMFLHSGWMHLLGNIIVQLRLGVALNYIYPGWQILLVYFSGGLFATFFTAIHFPHFKAIGASGGVYALLSAMIFRTFAVLVMREMTKGDLFRYLGTICVCYIAVHLSSILYLPIVSHVAHLYGAIGGALMGLMILQNSSPLLHDEVFERKLKLTASSVFCVFLIVGIMFHLISCSI